MDKPVISSLTHPLVKQARALRQRKARGETGLFLVEGIHHVGEAFSAGWKMETVLYAPDHLTSKFARDLLAQVTKQGISVRQVSVKVMESIADKENPQGILAIARQRHLVLTDLKSIRAGAAVVSPQDPGNVGTILRTLDAVGADYLVLANGGVDPYHPTSVRASMGALFWKPIVEANFTELTAWARKNGTQMIGSSAHAETDYRNFVPQNPWLLVLGSEQKGLLPDQLNVCDVTIKLPMMGRASSLNLAVAGGILLYQFLSINPD